MTYKGITAVPKANGLKPTAGKPYICLLYICLVSEVKSSVPSNSYRSSSNGYRGYRSWCIGSHTTLLTIFLIKWLRLQRFRVILYLHLCNLSEIKKKLGPGGVRSLGMGVLVSVLSHYTTGDTQIYFDRKFFFISSLHYIFFIMGYLILIFFLSSN